MFGPVSHYRLRIRDFKDRGGSSYLSLGGPFVLPLLYSQRARTLHRQTQ